MLLDGKVIAQKILANLQTIIAKMDKKPCLAVILVGNDPASAAYVKIKEQTAKKIGVNFKKFTFFAKDGRPKTATLLQNKIIKLINQLNIDKNITGIIVQLPLPKKINTNKILNVISVDKDIDGLNSQNQKIIPPTPAAILEILSYYHIDLAGKNVVLVGHGRLVGKPLAKILQKMPENINLTICDSQTKNLAKITKKADILITAAGSPHLIKKDMVKKGAVVIDAGTSIEKTQSSKLKAQNNKIIGDVDFESIKDKCSFITPPVGGVGPVTVAKLMENVVEIKK